MLSRMGCGGAAVAMDSSAGDGICLSQKLSQVSLHSAVAPPPRSLDQLLSSLAEDDFALPEEPICSQDFFCTPDFLTPVEQQFPVHFDANKENVPTIPSPVKCSPIRSKRPRPDSLILLQSVISLKDNHTESQSDQQLPYEEASDGPVTELQSHPLMAHADYIPPNSKARIANMRRRVLSPPCVKNPFKSGGNEDVIPNGRVHLKQAQFLPALGANCSSRYKEEFHEIQEIGRGNFSSVFKVLKRIDGCLYAVKRIRRQLRQDNERRQALTEVQALAALGLHENIVRYHTAWFENDQLYIQMELCDGTLRNRKPDGFGSAERFLLEALRQIAQALAFLHSSGLAHLDVKPDNIYFVGNTFKIGDFGRATRLDGSIAVEEGDARYMPSELLNDDYSHLPKADIFALGASIYELARDLPLPSSGSQFQALRHGKLALLPGFSTPFQNLLKSLMHPNPEARPTAQDLLRCTMLRNLGSC